MKWVRCPHCATLGDADRSPVCGGCDHPLRRASREGKPPAAEQEPARDLTVGRILLIVSGAILLVAGFPHLNRNPQGWTYGVIFLGVFVSLVVRSRIEKRAARAAELSGGAQGSGIAEGARCATHAGSPAVAACKSCGRAVCTECRIRWKAKVYCPPCFTRLPGRARPLSGCATTAMVAAFVVLGLFILLLVTCRF